MKNEIYLTIITTIVAVLGIIFTVLQFILARKKRKDDLFNLRYDFYRQVSKIWLDTYDGRNPPLDTVDLIPISEKAEFLFGREITNHILSLVDKNASNEFFPDDDFSNPFRKYLKLN
jgi:hypothetical protein